MFDYNTEENLNNMIKTVTGEYHWPPNVIGGFFVDDNDYNGLSFWYNMIAEQDKKIKG